jgi:RND family efflux transporter MFP subunit
MIVFLTLLYVAILAILVKTKLIKLTLWWKLSPILWSLFLLVVLFIPMQWGAPRGDVLVAQRTVQIVPNVAGQVIDVPVGPNQQVEKGDVLFRIDPRPFQYRLDSLKGQLQEAESSLKLAKIEIDRNRKLARSSAASQREVDQWQARFEGNLAAIERVNGQLREAEYNLEQTTVRAPSRGVVINVEALRPGARVVSFPVQQAMAFIDGEKRIIGMQIHQIYLRHVEAGQPVEVTFKILPGHVFPATVEMIVPGTGAGQFPMSGMLPVPRRVEPGPFFVRIVLEDEGVAKRLPLGAVGTAAIYTSIADPTYIIRRVMMRMDAWLNYVKPF